MTLIASISQCEKQQQNTLDLTETKKKKKHQHSLGCSLHSHVWLGRQESTVHRVRCQNTTALDAISPASDCLTLSHSSATERLSCPCPLCLPVPGVIVLDRASVNPLHCIPCLQSVICHSQRLRSGVESCSLGGCRGVTSQWLPLSSEVAVWADSSPLIGPFSSTANWVTCSVLQPKTITAKSILSSRKRLCCPL